MDQLELLTLIPVLHARRMLTARLHNFENFETFHRLLLLAFITVDEAL